MGLRLRVKTNKVEEESLKLRSEKEESDLEPLSPTAEYFNSDSLSVCIIAVLESEIPINLPDVYTTLNDVFLSFHPRFSSILIKDTKGKQMWKKVEVNVHDHVKVPIFRADLPIESYNQLFDDYISQIVKEQLPYDKPLWELHLYKYSTNHAVETFILKMHHAIADGVSLMGAVISCFRRADDPSLPLAFPSSRSRESNQSGAPSRTLKRFFSNVPRFVASVFYSLYDFGQSIRVIFFEDDRTPIRFGNAHLRPHSVRIYTITFSLADVRRIKAPLGVTVNDVIVGAIYLGAQLYAQEINQGTQSTRSTAIIILNTRSINGYARPEEMRSPGSEVQWGNKFTVIHLPLPFLDNIDVINPLNFVMKAHKIIKSKRKSFAPYLMAGLLEATRIFRGPQAAARVFEAAIKNSSFAITNLVGPTDKMSVANHPIRGFYFMPVGAKLSLTVSVMSYMQNLRIGLAVEEGFIDGQRFVKCVENAFQLILRAAMGAPKPNEQVEL